MKRILGLLGLAFVLSVLAGCMKLDVVVYIEPDGSVTIRESMIFSKRVLDYKDASGKSLVAKYLEKASADARAKNFSANCVVKSHKTESLYGGEILVYTEYKVPELTGINVFTPYLSYENYPAIKESTFLLKPIYKSGGYAGDGTAGELGIEFNVPKGAVSSKPIGPNDPPAIPPDPSILQPVRDLQPMFSDLLTGFRVSLRLESYSAMYTGFGFRGRGTNPKYADILSFSGDDYDRVGGKILENDEIMQEILRLKFGELNLVNTTRTFPNNDTVPVLAEFGSAYMRHIQPRVLMRPSRALFDKYFAGKDLDFDKWQSSGKNIRKANFDEIGAKEEPAKPQPKPAESTPPPPAKEEGAGTEPAK